MSGREGKRHPLPQSGEARHSEIPETEEIEKGRGEEGEEITTPSCAVDPDGNPYHYDDLGR